MSFSNSTSVLITGGAGFIGSHLARKLKGLGHRVISLDLRQPRPMNQVEGIEYVRGDVRDLELLESLVSRVGLVYHFAATVSVPLCQQDPAESYSNNLMATIGVLETIRKRAQNEGKDPIGFVFASSAALYGNVGDDGRALSETDTAASFSSFYAAQKHAAEKAIELYRETARIPSAVFRFFNVYGPGQDPTSPYSGVITLFLRYAREGQPLPLNGGGSQTRDFISVHDIANACASLLTLDKTQWDATPVNLGSGSRITIRELAELIKKAHGGKSELISAPAREGDVLHSLADITKARHRLGFAPKHDLGQSLAEI